MSKKRDHWLTAVMLILLVASCTMNQPPVVGSISSEKDTVKVLEWIELTVQVTDPDTGDHLYIMWEAPDGGSFTNPEACEPYNWWKASEYEGIHRIIFSATDSVNEPVKETLSVVVVQDYFPLGQDYLWRYFSPYQEDTIYYEMRISDVTVFPEGDTVYRLDRGFFRPRGGDTMWFEPCDKLLTYTVCDQSVLFYDPGSDTTYLGLVLPLYPGDKWLTGEGGTGQVTEQVDHLLKNSIHVEIAGGEVERDFWLSPGVGMTETTEKFEIDNVINDTVELDFKLCYYRD